MRWLGRIFVAGAGLLLGFVFTESAIAQKQGGILRVFHRDSPASMSILEEGSISAIMPMMGVFNNLVLFDQHVPQNRVETIVPDLATSWNSNEEGTELTFTLRDDVKWHDGKPFTAADVKCTYDLLTGRAKEKLRLNYREAWFLNLDEVTTNGDREVTFHLRRPQPAFISLLASGYSPIYPCHISARDMRTHPIGTGAPSNSSNTSPTSPSKSCATRIIGSRVGLTWMASSTQLSPTARPQF